MQVTTKSGDMQTVYFLPAEKAGWSIPGKRDVAVMMPGILRF